MGHCVLPPYRAGAGGGFYLGKEMIRKPKQYLWRGELYSLSQVMKVYNKEHPDNTLTIPALRSRLRNTNDDIDAGLNYVKKSCKKGPITKFTCPDGEIRCHSEIARHFGVTYYAWYSKFRKTDSIEKAWKLQLDEKKSKLKAPYISKARAETIRQQKALENLPSCTSYEADLYK